MVADKVAEQVAKVLELYGKILIVEDDRGLNRSAPAGATDLVSPRPNPENTQPPCSSPDVPWRPFPLLKTNSETYLLTTP